MDDTKNNLGLLAVAPLAITTILLKYTTVFQQICTMFLRLIGLQWYCIDSHIQVGKLLPYIKFAGVRRGQYIKGWFCGKWFIGYYSVEHDEYHVLMRVSQFTSVITEEALEFKKVIQEPGKLFRYTRNGRYDALEYYKFAYEISKEPFTFQQYMIDKIIEVFDKKSYCVVFIYGPIGSCKSLTANLLARQLSKTYENVSLVDTFNPSDPGDTFDNLYYQTMTTVNNPLVVALEEIDILIDDVHNSRIRRHRDLPISVYNKSTWTLFMDRFDREQFKNVILVMTSNKPKSYFDELDPAYLRQGRIDLVFDIEEVKKKCE